MAAPKSRTSRNVRDPGPDRELWIPSWLPPLVYALVTVLLFREFFFGHADLLGTDTLALGYFARDFYTSYVTTMHQFPLWDPMLYGGLPFVAGMHGDIFYPVSLALFFLNAQQMWGWKMVLHVFLAGVFAYLWLRGLGLRRGSAFFGGLVYMLGADLVSLVYPGGDGKLFVSTLAPLVFWLTDRAARRGRLSDYAFFSLGIALVVFTSHMQLAYFTVWGVSLFFFFRIWERWRTERRGRMVVARVGAFALAGALGVGAAAVQFVPPLQYLRGSSQRARKTVQAQRAAAYQYSTTYSLHQEELVALVVPEFVGDNAATETRTGNTYWGRGFFKLNSEFAGFIPLLLVPLLFLRRRTRETWFFAGLGLFAVVYASGATTPLFHLFYLIPGVKLFRAPSIIIFLYGLSLATLGAMGLERLVDAVGGTDDERRGVRRVLWGAVGIMLVLALAAASGALLGFWKAVVFTSMTPQQDAALQANEANIRLGFWLAFVLAALVASTWEVVDRQILGWRAALGALAVLAIVDLYRADRPFIRATMLMDRVELPRLIQGDESVQFLQRQQAQGEVFRAWDLGAFPSPLQNVLAVHGIEQLAGHHGNDMGRYRNLIGGEVPENATKSGLRLLDITNTEFIVSPQRLRVPGLTEAFVGRRSAVYRKDGVLPRAYLVGRVEVVPDSQAVGRLLAANFDAHGTAILPAPLPAGIDVQPDPQGTVSWTRRGTNASTLQVTSDRPALLMVSDNYYDAWKALVDGRPTPLLRANYTFRAIPVPGGQHTVEMVYESGTLQASARVSAALLILLLITGVGSELWSRRRRRGIGP